MLSHRIEKVATAADVAAELKGVTSVAVGGVSMSNKPMSLLEILLSSNARGMKYSGLSGCAIDLDFAVSQGGVSETFVPVALYGGTKSWPHYRSAAEAGKIAAHIVDVATVMAGYFASAEGVPFHPVTAVGGSDVTTHNPLLEYIEDARFGKVGIVRPISPDICLIHAQKADAEGNALVLGGTASSERLLARAAKRVIVSCDELVPVGEISVDSTPATIPGMYIDQVCHIPSGAWPTASPGLYVADRDYVRAYWEGAEKGRREGDEDLMKRTAAALADDLRRLSGKESSHV